MDALHTEIEMDRVQQRKPKSMLFLEFYCNVKQIHCSSNMKFWIISHHLLVNWRHVALDVPTRGEARNAAVANYSL